MTDDEIRAALERIERESPYGQLRAAWVDLRNVYAESELYTLFWIG